MRTARGRRLRPLDRILLATLLPAFAVTLAIETREGLENDLWMYRFVVEGAADAASHPTVVRVDDPSTAGDLRPGDVLLRVGEFDLRGAANREAIALATRAAAGGPRATVVAERDGRRFETWIERLPQPLWWAGVPTSLAIVAIAALVLLKAPRTPGVRAFFVGSCAMGLNLASVGGRILQETPTFALIHAAMSPLMMGALVAFALRFTDSDLPMRPWQRGLPYLVGGTTLFGIVAYFWLPPLALGLSNNPLYYLGHAISVLVMLGALARSYRRADMLERRQTKWAVYGFVVCILPVLALYLLTAMGKAVPWLDAIFWIAPIAVPIGFAVAVAGYGWLDIDRLISATASLAILGVVALGAALALVPSLANWLTASIGLDAAVGQWALSLAVVGAAIPVHLSLRPWLDRRIFADQAARMAGFELLLTELSACGTAGELTLLTAERIDALLAPDSIALYAREGNLYTPIFVRGQAAPPAFQSDCMLVRALEARLTPLAAGDEALDAFDRAALTTLGAELVVPVRRTENLAAFACLGGKRSGDIYTATDRTVLSAVAHKIGYRLAQLDAEELARDTLAIQERLRRYVPGAVVDELTAGRELEPEEREVSVLFVDLRGYTSFAEGRAAHDVFSTINEHTERISALVKRYGGTVVEFNGDGMMAVFGAPGALAHKERAAVQAGREIVEGMPETLQVGVGIATGEAVVGSIRSADRWIWSAIGNTTNLAARLQSLTRELDAAIAVDEATHRAAGYVCHGFEHREGIAIRGRRGRWDVFTLQA